MLQVNKTNRFQQLSTKCVGGVILPSLLFFEMSDFRWLELPIERVSGLCR
jgi:hypothetical protein